MLLQRSVALVSQLLPKPFASWTIQLRPESTSVVPSSQTYRYTLDSPNSNATLNNEQRAFYEANGYLLIKNMVGHQDLERWEKRFHEYATGKRKPESSEMILQREYSAAKGPINENTLYKIGELHTDAVLYEYVKYPKLLDHVECFTGPNIMAIHTMVIIKPPDTGTKATRHPLHQDLCYLPNRPEDRIVGAWTAMDRINRDNGCLVVLPGTHKSVHLEHHYPKWEGGVNKLYYGVMEAEKYLKVPRLHLIVEPGDTILLHPLLIHGSGINRTKKFRKCISAHYAPVESTFFDPTGHHMQAVAEELLATFAKKSGKRAKDYATFWKLRARLVRGEGGYTI